MNMGQYIDSLNDEQRDRIVEGMDWEGDNGVFVGIDGCRCLVGHAEDWWHKGTHQIPRDRTESFRTHRGRAVWNQYPRALRRFGLGRVVRAIKLRAGASIVLQENPRKLAPEAEKLGAVRVPATQISP